MKKEQFKYLIKEFHEQELATLHRRNITLPETNKIITLTGPRRCGKTFIFYQLIRELLKKIPKDRIVYINFEDDRLLPLNSLELGQLIEAYYELYPANKDEQIFLFFDEVQTILDWETFVRRLHDKENVKMFVTGSSSKMLSKDIATSLRGRTITRQILPLSFHEFLRFQGIETDSRSIYSKTRFTIKKHFERYLELGGYPEITLEKNGLELDILRNYFEIMIYRDIVERYSVRNNTVLKMLTKYLFTNIGSKFSLNAYYTSLKKSIPISKDTIFEYTSHLEESEIIFLVPLFSYSLKIQQANPKKAYCIDNGLRNAISFKFSRDEGKLAKNAVFVELKRRGHDLYYWQGKGEVDFVVKGERILAINVCYSDNSPKRERESLKEFQRNFPGSTAVLLTKDTEKKEENIEHIPLWKWLIT